MERVEMTDKEILEKLLKELNEVAKKTGVKIEIVEIKGTIYYFPKLPPKD
jgi:hypothetical protein